MVAPRGGAKASFFKAAAVVLVVEISSVQQHAFLSQMLLFTSMWTDPVQLHELISIKISQEIEKKEKSTPSV